MAQQWPLGSAGAWTHSGLWSIFHSLNYWAITVTAFHCSGSWRITRLISLVKLYFFNRAYLHSYIHLEQTHRSLKGCCGPGAYHRNAGHKVNRHLGWDGDPLQDTMHTDICTLSLRGPRSGSVKGYHVKYFVWRMFFSIIIFIGQGVDLQLRNCKKVVKLAQSVDKSMNVNAGLSAINFFTALNVAYKNWTWGGRYGRAGAWTAVCVLTVWIIVAL